MKRLNVVQPFLYAAFPLLSLLASNRDFVRPAELLLPLALVAGATALLLLASRWLLKDLDAAAITLSVFWLLFFSYGRLFRLIGGGSVREALLILGCLALLAATVAFVLRWRGRLQTVAGIVTIAGLALVAMPLASLAPALLARPRARLAASATSTAPAQSTIGYAEPETPANSRSAQHATATPSPTPPDIYYIILDGYARADVLRDIYSYNDADFLAGLADRGFYVASGSRCNYIQTYLSLDSSLNMTYLDELAAEVGEDSEDRAPLQDLLKYNAVAGLLKERGYTYVAISTGYADQELAAADVFLSAGWSLSQFESGLLNSTPLTPLIEMQHEMHRQRLLYAFEQLTQMPEKQGPLFVLAHIAAPHPPFVFGPNGERITPNREFEFSDGPHFIGAGGTTEEYLAGYKGQVNWVNSQIEPVLDAIVTLKNYYRKHPAPIADAERQRIPVYVLRANTINQMESALGDIFGVSVEPEDPLERAVNETREAIRRVLAGSDAEELPPANAEIRRLQHEMARAANLVSHSYGNEPRRRVRIFQG